MFRLVKSEAIPLTRELALQYRDLEPSPTEREISPARLKMLRDKATAGLLITFHWAQARLGNEVYRMNGQHSANMLCELLDGSFPEGLYAHLDEYAVDSRDDLALLFRQFDDRKSGRSAGDVAGAYQGLVEALRDIPKDLVKLGIEGVAWYEHWIVGMPVPDGDSRYGLFNQSAHHAFLHWLPELFSIKTPELKRVPVLAAIYGTWTKSAAGAQEFWHQVARGGIEYEDDAPSTVLDAWLKDTKEANAKAKVERGLVGLKPYDFYNGCIYAWNAFRSERRVKDKKIKPNTDKGITPIHE